MFFFRFLLIAALLPVSTSHNGWSVVGPGGGGAMFHPTISPHDPNRVLVGCDMTGSYLSEDGGKSWKMFNLRGPARFFLFDPSDPKVAYAKTIGLWRSADSGHTWTMVYPANAAIEADGDHADERVVSDEPGIDALTIHQGRLWAAMGTALKSSRDGGKTWAPVATLPERGMHIVGDAGRIHVIGANSLSTVEGGKSSTWPHAAFVDVAAGIENGKVYFYGASKEGLFISGDGQSWRKSSLHGSVRAVAASERNGRTAYASYQDGASFGVARTADGGETWTLGWKESRQKAVNVDDGWVSDRFGPGWGEHPLTLGVSPTQPELAYGTDLGRTLRTTDGGATWRNTYTNKMPDGSYASTGLDVTTNYGIHFDPFRSSHLFLSVTDIGMMMSENGGQSWRSATEHGVPEAWWNTTYWIEFDPQVKDRIYAVTGDTHDLPRPKMWRFRSPMQFKGGVVRSDDGGKTWRALKNGLPETSVTHLLLDRDNHERLYITGFGRGVFRSDDGGTSWQKKSSGLPEKEPFAWRLAQDSKGTLYLVVARRSEDGSIGNDRDGALYKSADHGDTWQRASLPEGVNGPNGIVVDSKDPRRLYLAAWARKGAKNGGIFLSEDAGVSWKNVHSADQHVYDVTQDPARPEVLYATGYESSVWRSGDRGATWKRVPGYDFKWGQRVTVDPYAKDMIYVSTFGGGVWHGPAR
ncbi:WD40/YVTN/BNR-like repeat-containing protein [Paludibaculum fermentans]|uniref:Sortilin N-terminal domain-containing protein n=1 Tax=Paludibaculum fermentans TaxID=1473598 RepID=A0A7S7SNV6_PALFE|nr:sialidase family protein [Paludibaculum fermentans]QOY90936.1 hypothetical protein IRI77_13605 [Paludibaculum fermentans]